MVCYVIMKLIYLNIGGLGGRIKKKEVRDMVKVQKPDMICLQESKVERVDRNLCLCCGWMMTLSGQAKEQVGAREV